MRFPAVEHPRTGVEAELPSAEGEAGWGILGICAEPRIHATETAAAPEHLIPNAGMVHTAFLRCMALTCTVSGDAPGQSAARRAHLDMGSTPVGTPSTTSAETSGRPWTAALTTQRRSRS